LKPVLLTGVAGFIGYHLAQRLLNQGVTVIGVDCLSDYYDPQLKRDRLELLVAQGLQFRKLDLSVHQDTLNLFREFGFEQVIHLAAQAGVRYSKTNPHAYTSSNIEGFLNILEGCRSVDSRHLLYASSSSVYGSNRKLPFSTQDLSDTPVSLYGATKKANELMAHSYAWMYGVPCTGLRFFTVYGPWGRPDMALYLFASAILEDRPLSLFNHGKMMRDFTYVDDVVESLVRLLPSPPSGQPGEVAPAQVLNVGNHSPVQLKEFLRLIEEKLGKKAQVELLPMQSGDVEATYAEVSELQAQVDFRPDTALAEGIDRSLSWYLDYRRKRGI
jgi:UDP-glucuronate 4-epimerase